MSRTRYPTFPGIAHPKKLAFLRLYPSLGTVTATAKAVTITRRSHVNWLHDDPVYAAAFRDSVKPAACDRLEAEAIRRAVKGMRKPVYQGKELVGYIQEYSDTLLIFLLKGHAPEKYRDRVEHSGTVRHEVRVDLTQLSRRELEQYRLLTAKIERSSDARAVARAPLSLAPAVPATP